MLGDINIKVQSISVVLCWRCIHHRRDGGSMGKNFSKQEGTENKCKINEVIGRKEIMVESVMERN